MTGANLNVGMRIMVNGEVGRIVRLEPGWPTPGQVRVTYVSKTWPSGAATAFWLHERVEVVP